MIIAYLIVILLIYFLPGLLKFFLKIKMSYWEIDDFLSEEEKITVRFEQEVKNIGFLDANRSKHD